MNIRNIGGSLNDKTRATFGAVCAAIVIITTGAFAETPSTSPAITTPNTITYDFGPTIVGMMINSMAKSLSDDVGDGGGGGFGFGLQYERQLDAKHSVGGRIAYIGWNVNFSDDDYYSGESNEAALRMPAWSFEANGRIYPYASSFFVNGMLGIGTLGVGITGDIEVYDRDVGDYVSKYVDDDFTTAFFKLGVKTGWRWVTGDAGGLTVELAFGYNIATGIGDGISRQIAREVGGEPEDELDALFEFLGAFFFHGGMRMTIGVGWQF